MDRKAAREQLMKAKIYRAIAIACGVAGLLLFIVIYIQQLEGNLLRIIDEPFFIIFFILPFVPAMIMLHISGKAEKKVQQYFEANKTAENEPQD